MLRLLRFEFSWIMDIEIGCFQAQLADRAELLVIAALIALPCWEAGEILEGPVGEAEPRA